MHRLIPLALVAVALCSFGVRAEAEKPPEKSGSGYSFTLNGEPYEADFVHLEGTPEKPAPGDLFEIADLWMVLGQEKNQAYHLLSREEGVLWVEGPGGRRRAAAARVRWEFTNEKDENRQRKRKLVNPLQNLPPEDIGELRGIELDAWTDDVARSLKSLNPRQACVMLHGDAVVGAKREFPPLPSGLRHLMVRENNNFAGIQDYQPIRELKELRFLSLNAMVGAFDCNFIREAKGITHLTLRPRTITNVEALGDLAELRDLDLHFNRDVKSVAFAQKLTKLETLNLFYTAVDDLTVLGGHPALRHIDARSTPLSKLPLDKPMPALRVLDALSARVSETDGKAFAKLNPRCKLKVTWRAALLDALEGVDRVRVRTGGTCHRDIARERTLHEEKDAAKVRDLIAQIQIDERQSGFHCMCCGEPSLEFFKGDKLVLTLGYHHGRSMRWVGGWPADCLLTPPSAQHFQKWLAQHVPEIENAQKQEVAYARQQADELEKFVSHFPEKVRPMLRQQGGSDPIEGDQKVGRQIAAAVADEKALITAACRALGGQEGYSASWSSTADKERRVLAAVEKVSGENFLQMLQENKDERRTLLGAARLFFFEKFEQKLPKEARSEWLVRLSEAALQDGFDGNKGMVLRHLAYRGDAGARALLRDVMLGKKGTEIKKADLGEPGLRAGAALGLALAKEGDLKVEVEKLLAAAKTKSDTAALQVALALLGDPGQLRDQHFQLQSYSIGLGAIRAIEQFEGGHGLELLIVKGMDHPWAAVRDEAEAAVQRITGKKFPEDDRHDAIRAWWREQGPAFVESRRKGKP